MPQLIPPPLKALLFITTCLLFSYTAKAQWVTIPDANFAAFLQQKYPGCMNGNQMDITCQAIVYENYLDCRSQNIADLTGIEYFTNLYTLDCSYNQITFISTLPSAYLDLLMFNNNLITGAIPFPPTLTEITGDNNPGISIDYLPAGLRTFSCSNCGISRIDQPSFPDSLRHLNLQNNLLSVLPTLPPYLQSLVTYGNYFTTLPYLPPTLTTLVSGNNQLTSIANLPPTLDRLDLSYNAALTCIPPLLNYVGPTGFFDITGTGIQCLPNRIKHSGFEPQIDNLPICDIYNQNSCAVYGDINGTIYLDVNNDCAYQDTEQTIPLIKVDLLQAGTVVQSGYFNGAYNFIASPATYTVVVDTSTLPLAASPCTASATLILSAQDTTHLNVNFGLHCKAGFDVGVKSINGTLFRPANVTAINVDAGNMLGPQTTACVSNLSGTVQLSIAGPATYVSPASGALTPSSVVGNTITWNIADYGTVNFFSDFNIIIAVDTFAQAGQQVCISVSVTPVAGDNYPANNTLSQCFAVRTSYDPNNKEVSPLLFIDTADRWLTYTVNFQNTGNDTAIHIYIDDTLDNNLDPATVQLLAYSVSPVLQVNGNAMRFNFPNIMLPDSNVNEPASHGYVQYRVKLKPGVAYGDSVKNTAFIYFDFNPPVLTNTTLNYVGTPCIVSSATISADICQGDTFMLGGTALTTAGTYSDTLVNSLGCDSMVVLSLRVLPSYLRDTAVALCNGDSVMFDGQAIYTPGSYTATYQNVFGCDSVIRLQVSAGVSSSVIRLIKICAGEYYLFNDDTLRTDGLYTDTLTGVSGCDSVVGVQLNVWPVYASAFSDTVCAGRQYNFNGTLLDSAGTYTETFQSVAGCDSVVTLSLYVRPYLSSATSAVICDTGVYYFAGIPYTETGMYNGIFTSVNGCDSVVTLSLTVLPAMVSVSASACTGTPYNFHGTLLTQAGTYTDTLANMRGCDSVVVLTLTVLDDSTFIEAGICFGNSYLFNGAPLQQAGTYRHRFTNSLGCDSLVELSLDVRPVFTETTTATICQGEEYVFQGGSLTAPGIYYDTLVTVQGCDSIIVLQLNVDSINAGINRVSANSLIAAGNGTIQWINCDTRQPLPGETGNVLSVATVGNYAAVFSYNLCTDTTACMQAGPDGIEDINVGSISIYPNPAADQLYLVVENMRPQTATLYNVSGRKLSERPFAPQLDISTLPAGVYFIEVKNASAIARAKFIKM